MGKPIVHARSSAKRFGGKARDYIKIHEFIDSSREAFSDLRHRALTHNGWFITKIIPLVFGQTIKNSKGKDVPVVSIAEFHVMEDYGNNFIPTAQDFLAEIEFKPWMDNGKDGEIPPSHVKLKRFHGTLPKALGFPSGGKAIELPAVPQVDLEDEFRNRPCARVPGMMD